MKIDAFLTPFFPEKESQFNDSIVIMIDVLRASTSVCSALYNGAKELIPSDSLDKAVHIYSSLSREIRFLGGERNGIKPSGFDAGNSPTEYSEELVKGKTVIIATTNGTKIFQKAKQAHTRIIAGFVNINAILNYINESFIGNPENRKDINLLCAGTNGRLSYEDTLCCGAIIESLLKFDCDFQMTDTAFAAKSLFNLHSSDLKNFLKTREHSLVLEELGFSNDIEIALEFDKYPVVPVITGNSIKKFEDNI